MFRSSAILLFSVMLFTAGCGEGAPDTPFVSEAIAAPAPSATPAGWRSSVSESAVTDTTYEY